jgi:hypothetical protein
MFRLIVNIVFFVVGAGLGVLWGVNHPSQAQNIATREQITASKAKIEILEKIGDKIPNGQQMLDDEKKKLADEQAAAPGNP